MRRLLGRIYRRLGIHTAPPGTVRHAVHSIVHGKIKRRRQGRTSEPAWRRGKYGAIRYYDIVRQRQIRPVEGLALIFFMGAGDYLMATPLIRALRQAHPDLPIYAYASTSTDTVSSALVHDLLQINPLIDRVFRYDGRPRDVWTDYDFAPALDAIPANFLALPVLYDVDSDVLHRTTSLLETFGLPIDFPLPIPIAYEAVLSPNGETILHHIVQRIMQAAPKGIVCLQLDTRSSHYEYPFTRLLAESLARHGHFVISFSRTGSDDPAILDVDTNSITPPDTIEILRTLCRRAPGLAIISVNSLLWPISAALRIPNLGLHIFRDMAMHQYHYPNIYVVTEFFYPRLSPFHQFRAGANNLDRRSRPPGSTPFTDFKPEFVTRCFDAMISQVRDIPSTTP